MKISLRLTILMMFAVCGLSSCYINRDFMFQTDSDFVFDELEQDSSNADFKIKPNTLLSINIFTNDGSLLLEYSTGGGEGRRFMINNSIAYLVDPDGYVNLPIIGKQYINGMSIREVQEYLSNLYEERYNDTFVIVSTENRRVMVYNGNNGRGQVVPLGYNGISIIEAITLAGGIGASGDASKVRVFRKKDNKREVYELDLSKVEGIKYANTAVESGDIIYVQPVPRLGREILENIQPIVSIISSASILYLVFARAL